MKSVYQIYAQLQLSLFVLVSVAAVLINTTQLAVGQKISQQEYERKQISEEIRNAETKLSNESSFLQLSGYISDNDYVKITKPTASNSPNVTVASR